MIRSTASIPAVFVLVAGVASAQLAVVGTNPALNANNVAANATIAIDFDRPLAPTSIPPTTNDATAFGSISGPLTGTWSLENGGARLRFTPARRSVSKKSSADLPVNPIVKSVMVFIA